MARGDDFLASITRIAPQATIDPGDEDESPSQPEVIAAAIAAAVANLPVQRPQLVPVPTDVDVPDLAPLLEAFERSRLEPSALGEAIGAAVLAAFEGQADTVPALEAIVTQLEVMSKRFSGVVAGGGGGGPTEVGLRTGPDGSVVSPTNPLSVSIVSTPTTSLWDYRAGVGADTVTLVAGQRVKKITAIALGAQGTLAINGGDTITMPYDSTDHTSSSLELVPEGTLDGATIEFDAAVDSWVVEFETDA